MTKVNFDHFQRNEIKQIWNLVRKATLQSGSQTQVDKNIHTI